MEAKAIPKPTKKTDKGIAAKLRELHGSFSEYFEGVSRRTIYSTARRIGFKAITRTEGEGLRVWRGEPVKQAAIDKAETDDNLTYEIEEGS
jgi:hypothetical protein